MKTNAQFNMNSKVTVHLTERGINILKNEHEEYLKLTLMQRGYDPYNPTEFERPENNMYTDQMWVIMQKFGLYIGPWQEAPFFLSIVLHDVEAQVKEEESE